MRSITAGLDLPANEPLRCPLCKDPMRRFVPGLGATGREAGSAVVWFVAADRTAAGAVVRVAAAGRPAVAPVA
jgi:hypothetical protein